MIPNSPPQPSRRFRKTNHVNPKSLHTLEHPSF